ncbi:hypothetical protein [Flavobacterium sp.]|uniref:hypothetical protein n=1 Tax=Flavobacterium sp. TaxID=239 RepID=UPI00333E3A28
MKKIIIKSILLIFGILLFYACSSKNFQNKGDNPRESIEEIITKPNAFHLKLNIDSLLNSYKTKISNLDKDELVFPLDSVIESDSSRVVVIVKFINKKDVFAIDIYGNWQTQNIYFYKFGNGVWEKLKSDTFDSDILHFSFENFSTDDDFEILFLGHPNMNGNRQHTIYKYDSKENYFEKSGEFFCDKLSFDTCKSILYFEYGGSWYTPNEKSTYKWVGNKIIPIKKVSLELKKYNYKSFKQWISYYENPTQDKDTLVLKYKKTYNEKNKKLYDLWENFFDKK